MRLITHLIQLRWSGVISSLECFLGIGMAFKDVFGVNLPKKISFEEFHSLVLGLAEVLEKEPPPGSLAGHYLQYLKEYGISPLFINKA